MPSSRPSDRFADIVANIDAIGRYTAGMDESQYLSDPKTLDATITCFMRISEAAAKQDRAAYTETYTTAAIQRRSMCAFNDETGSCTLYPVRPLICRKAHALETPDWCGPHEPDKGRVKVLEFEPVDQFVKRAFALLWATHHALGQPRGRAVALCQRVYQLLTEKK